VSKKEAALPEDLQRTLEEIRELGNSQLGPLIDRLASDPRVDKVHLNEARKSLKLGIMYARRSIEKPTDF